MEYVTRFTLHSLQFVDNPGKPTCGSLRLKALLASKVLYSE
jgi:hypothetical protein